MKIPTSLPIPELFEAGKLKLAQANEPATPTLAFGDGDSGLYEKEDDVIYIDIGGIARWYIATTYIGSLITGGFRLNVNAATDIIPDFTFEGDVDTGVGHAGADILSLIAGGVEAMRLTETAGVIQAIVPLSNTPATPTIAFGDGDTGFYEGGDDLLRVSIAGTGVWEFTSGFFRYIASNGSTIYPTQTATSPGFCTRDDTDTGIGHAAADALSLIAGGVEAMRLTEVAGAIGLTIPSTITAPGTTGNQTINKPAGRVNIAAAGTTVTVTNSVVTANSIVLAVAATADATARVTSVVPAEGSFVINTVAVTAETAFNFLVIS